MTKDNQIKRLTEEWIAHEKVIIAVDYDDTVFPFKSATSEDCNKIILLLQDCMRAGCYLLLFTARKLKDIDEAVAYCENRGLKIDAVNTNIIKDFKYGNTSKPFANIYLDDRAGLEQAYEVLSQALMNYRVYLNENKKEN